MTALVALPEMVRAASAALARAESSAAVLTARDMAGEAYDRAKRAARLAEAKGAHDSLVAAAHRAQADALEIEAAAKRRLADEYDAAQARGEVGRKGQRTDLVPDENKVATAKDIGLTRKDVFEARQLRDAIAERPGIVRQALDQLLERGDAPTRAALKRVVAPVAKSIRDSDRAENRQRRTQVINAIAEKGSVTAGVLPRAAFPILYADPPWQQEAWSDETGQDKGLMYPPMPLADIMALCAGDASPATRDAVLFLWVATNRLDDGIDVLRAWGFDYASSLVWDKVDIGMGRWVRDRHEILLIGKRGDFPAPLPGTQAASVHVEKKGRHSRKPLFFAEMIERLYPDMRKLELFQRRESLAEDDVRLSGGNWHFWGFEASGGAPEDGGEASGERPPALQASPPATAEAAP